MLLWWTYMRMRREIRCAARAAAFVQSPPRERAAALLRLFSWQALLPLAYWGIVLGCAAAAGSALGGQTIPWFGVRAHVQIAVSGVLGVMAVMAIDAHAQRMKALAMGCREVLRARLADRLLNLGTAYVGLREFLAEASRESYGMIETRLDLGAVADQAHALAVQVVLVKGQMSEAKRVHQLPPIFDTMLELLHPATNEMAVLMHSLDRGMRVERLDELLEQQLPSMDEFAPLTQQLAAYTR